jgi:hypothetical protein
MWNQRKDEFRAWMWLCLSRNDIFWIPTKTQAPRGWGLQLPTSKAQLFAYFDPTLEGFKMTDCDAVQQPKKCDDVHGFQHLNITISYILISCFFIMLFFIMGFPFH